MVYSVVDYKHVQQYILSRQKGFCRSCKKKIKNNDIVVSAGHVNKKYYHIKCAEILHIIWIDRYIRNRDKISIAIQSNICTLPEPPKSINKGLLPYYLLLLYSIYSPKHKRYFSNYLVENIKLHIVVSTNLWLKSKLESFHRTGTCSWRLSYPLSIIA